MKKLLMMSAFVAVSMSAHALADDSAPVPNPVDKNKTEMHEAGLGVTDGSYQGNHQGSVEIQGMNTRIENGAGTYGEYLSGDWHIGLGLAPGQSGFDLGFKEKSGYNLWQRHGNEPVVPLIGVEPLNLMADTSIGFNPSYHTQQTVLGPVQVQDSDPHRIPGHTPYLEWSPMASAGVQVLGDSCKAMLAIRGGASVGTLGDGGIRPAYGAGVSGVCKDVFQFDADVMRIAGQNTETDMANARMFFEIPGQHFGVGVAFDAMDTKANTGQVYSMPASGTAEVRGQGVIGGVF